MKLQERSDLLSKYCILKIRSLCTVTGESSRVRARTSSNVSTGATITTASTGV